MDTEQGPLSNLHVVNNSDIGYTYINVHGPSLRAEYP